jgi:hypothetical protein
MIVPYIGLEEPLPVDFADELFARVLDSVRYAEDSVSRGTRPTKSRRFGSRIDLKVLEDHARTIGFASDDDHARPYDEAASSRQTCRCRQDQKPNRGTINIFRTVHEQASDPSVSAMCDPAAI